MSRSLVALLLVGCGGGGVALGDYDASSLDARCEYYTRCGLFRDAAECHAHFDNALHNPSVQAAVDAGKVNYDGDAAKECFDALASASCVAQQSPSDRCGDVFKGTVPNGGMCAFDAECVSGNCAVSDCVDACCPGMCSPARPVPGIGEHCTFECVLGAYCAADSTCKQRLGVGASCDSALACSEGLTCAGFTQTSNGTCAKPPGTGEACTDVCANVGDYCSGTCMHDALLGDACSTTMRCSIFLACDMATMKCVEPPNSATKANGQPCTNTTECMSHYCGNDKKCADVPTCI